MNESKSSLFTVKNTLRVLSILCLVFVACPSFLVSCSGQDVKVSTMTAVEGMSAYGEQVVKPHPIMLICFVLPIIIFALLCAKKLADRKKSIAILASTVVEFVIWLIFRAEVKKAAEENYCTFKTTGWYVLNVIVMLVIIALIVSVIIGKITLETELQSLVKNKNIKEIAGHIVDVTSDTLNSNINKNQQIGFCTNCGAPIKKGCKFCTSCGTAVPEVMTTSANESINNESTEERGEKNDL